MLLLLGDLFNLWIRFNCKHGWLALHTWWWMIWWHLIFPTYHTFDAMLGHISVLVEIYSSPLICMIIPNYEIHVELMICFYFSLVEPFLSHSVRLILFYIVVILWWSCLRCIDSHIIILVEHLSDFLDILIGVSLSRWQTPRSFPSWSFLSHWQTHLLVSS